MKKKYTKRGSDKISKLYIKKIALNASLLMFLFGITVAIQIHLNAYGSDFGSDDSSHYVTGLLFYSYFSKILDGNFVQPIFYLKHFAAHYPLVGVGHWGPLYYGIEGFWFLIFGKTIKSAILLSAFVTSIGSFIVYYLCSKTSGRTFGIVFSLIFLINPIILNNANYVMLDIPITIACALAMLFYAFYLLKGGVRYSILFALAAACALLIKGNAACLAFLPVFAVFITRRFNFVRQLSFWIPVPIVMLVAGPWYFISYSDVSAGFRHAWGWPYSSIAIPDNAFILLNAVGPFLLGLCALAFIDVLFRRSDTKQSVLLQSSAALLVSVIVFQDIAPAAIQARYMAPGLIPLLVLAAHGGRILWSVMARLTRALSLPRQATVGIGAGLLLVMLGSALPAAMATQPRGPAPLVETAREVWAHRLPNNPVVLVAANGDYEASAIAALAARDPSVPSLYAIRGSRLLGTGGYNNSQYQPRFHSAAQVMAAINRYAIPFVLLRVSRDAHQWAHLKQIQEAIQRNPSAWKLLYKNDTGPVSIQLYELPANANASLDSKRIVALSAPRILTR